MLPFQTYANTKIAINHKISSIQIHGKYYKNSIMICPWINFSQINRIRRIRSGLNFISFNKGKT